MQIIEAIKNSAIKIKKAIAKGDTSYDTSINKTGDTQLKLDILSDKIIEEEFRKLDNIQAIISEEKEEKLILNKNANLIICYDPLDGSSLVDVNLSVGSIFGIYENNLDGNSLKMAVYVVYGPRVEMVVARDEVSLFRLNLDEEFEFVKNIKLENKGKINATGATQKGWSKAHASFVRSLFEEGYRLRYSGGMVPDLHQILLKGGGIFSYPATTDSPKGKLRMLFEVFPFAFIYEKANGMAVDGEKRLLELKPSHIHDTSPCFFGSKYEIQRLQYASS